MTYRFRIHDSIGQIDKALWNKYCPDDNPFLEYDFLQTLEISGSVGTVESGWLPQHIQIEDENQTLGFLPLYEKHDSYGEYIFDWGWANAAMQAGIQYYPKLVSAIPFTPVTGSRLLSSSKNRDKILEQLKPFLLNHIEKNAYSSAHILFMPEEEQTLWGSNSFKPRLAQQFHWRNRGWENYGEYLQALRAPTRKQVRKERLQAQDSCDDIVMKVGEEISSEEWRIVEQLYLQTIREKYAIPYLNPKFFELVKNSFSNRIACSLAYIDKQVVAAGLFYYKKDRLFGRYWGSFLDIPFLHFELCYYKPIEWAIAHGINYFEAGAQGTHKLKRGLLPTKCYSAHYIAHPALAAGVYRFIEHEQAMVQEQILQLNKHVPFKS